MSSNIYKRWGRTEEEEVEVREKLSEKEGDERKDIREGERERKWT